MTDKPFRVLLDLTELRLKNLKYVWINVSPRELKTIFDFKKSVLHKINLERKDIKVFVRDGLLLDEETIIVLREDDTVKVEYDEQLSCVHNYAENSFKENEKKLRKRKHSESNVNDNSTKSKNNTSETFNLTSNLNEFDFEDTKQRKKHKKHSLTIDRENGLADVEKSRVYKNSHKEIGKDKSITEQNIANVSLDKSKSLLTSIKDTFLQSKNCVLEIPENKNDLAEVEKSIAYENSQKKRNKRQSSIILDQSTENRDLNRKDHLFPSNVKEASFKSSEFCVPSEPVISKEATSRETINTSICYENPNVTKPSNINTNNIEKSNNCPKKKRKRHKKRKQMSINADVSGSCDINHSFKSPSESVVDTIKRKHILYSLSPGEQEDSCMDESNQFLTLPSGTFVKEIKPLGVEPLNDFPKVSTPAPSIDCGNPNWNVSLMSPKNPVTCLNVAQHCNVLSSCKIASPGKDKQMEKKCTSHTTEENEHTANKLYEDLPALNSLPDVGTCIAYKVLELGGNYCPVVTDYREGIIKMINPDTEEIEIELNKELIITGRIGKFENLAEDEVPPSVVKKCDIVKWSEMLSPKLLSVV